VIPMLIIVLLTAGFFIWAKMKGKLGNFSAGVGNALVEANAFVRPTAQQIVESKKQCKTENQQGDDEPPELPSWS
jgi:hypothetical protein